MTSRSRVAVVLALVVALLGIMEPARAYTVRTDRPRIWLTPAIVANLRARAAAGSPRWLALKHACDASATPSWDVGVISYALAYQVSGDPAEADKAIALMLKYANAGVSAISGDDG